VAAALVLPLAGLRARLGLATLLTGGAQRAVAPGLCACPAYSHELSARRAGRSARERRKPVAVALGEACEVCEACEAAGVAR
jgi:hypothetical protein